MVTCTICNEISPDDETTCKNCGADLKEYSNHAVSRKKLIANPRVTAIRVSVGKQACPTCLSLEGVYSKENLPWLPVQGCSNPNGCLCQYAPILDDIFP